MPVLSVGQEAPLEEGIAAPSSTRAWRIPRTEEPGGLRSMGSQRVRHDGPFLSAVLECQQTESSSFPSSFCSLVDVPESSVPSGKGSFSLLSVWPWAGLLTSPHRSLCSFSISGSGDFVLCLAVYDMSCFILIIII